MRLDLGNANPGTLIESSAQAALDVIAEARKEFRSVQSVTFEHGGVTVPAYFGDNVTDVIARWRHLKSRGKQPPRTPPEYEGKHRAEKPQTW